MRFRLPLLLLLAGCATPVAPSASTLRATAAEDVGRPAQASVVPPTASGDMIFDAWASDFQARALAAGVEPAVYRREMAGLSPDPRIAALDSRQPEFSKPIGDYLKGVVTADRVTIGQRRRADVAEFAAIESRYGVPREILIGIWALESGYGAIQGENDVLRSLATLAAQGRRRAWAEGEIVATLKIIQTGEHPRARLKGSWAGAMGQTQFIPTTYLATAVDQDGDGRRDIWGSRADALGSAANLLAKAGWTRGQGWAREVTVPPGFDFSLSEGPRETPGWWAEKGVRPADGQPWSSADSQAKAQLVAPAGASGPIFLLLPNHFVLRQYNNSLAYSLGVGLLADRLGGGAGVTRPWPEEQPLSLVDRMTAQRALAALGFDPGAPDGVIGMGTRRALRDWQKARGLTADGYLSGDMIRRLREDAAKSGG